MRAICTPKSKETAFVYILRYTHHISLRVPAAVVISTSRGVRTTDIENFQSRIHCMVAIVACQLPIVGTKICPI